MKRITIPYILLTVTLMGCSKATEQNTTSPDEEKTEVAASSQTNEVPVPDADYLSCSGTIEVPPQYHAAVHSRIYGMVSDIRAVQGDYVKKGRVLATIRHGDIVKLQENYWVAHSQLNFARAEYDRKKSLFAEEAIPQKELQQAEANYQSAQARFMSLKEQLTFIGLPAGNIQPKQIRSTVALVSPIEGTVTKVHVKNGAFLAADEQAFSIIDHRKAHLHLHVFPSDIHRIQKGQQVRFRLPGSDAEYKATVFLIGKAIDTDTRAISVHAEPEGDVPDLPVGGTVFAQVKWSEKE